MAIRHLSRVLPLNSENISKGYSVLRNLNQYTEKLEEIESGRKLTSNPIIAKNCPYRVGETIIHSKSGMTADYNYERGILHHWNI